MPIQPSFTAKDHGRRILARTPRLAGEVSGAPISEDLVPGDLGMGLVAMD